jgi:arylsulfatase A-like enzyme
MPIASPPVDLTRAHEAPLATLRLALWFGLLAGLGEVALLSVRKYFLHRFIGVSKEAVWMAPLADGVLFVLVGILLIGLRAVLPSRVRLPPVLIFAALAAFTLLLMYKPLYRPAAALLALGLGTVALRMARRWTPAFDKVVRRTLPIVVIVILLATAAVPIQAAVEEGRHRSGTTVARAGAPDILFIVLDTVRSWNLSVYGYARPTTPEIERWMRDGLRFDHALATAPWTLPSHATMFTGRFPHELLADWLTPLDATYPTLAEVLSARGYATAGFVANTLYCSYESGLGRGFVRYRDYPITVPQIVYTSSLARELGGARFLRWKLMRKSAEEVNEEFLDWLKARQDSRPYFVFLNYFDAHDPYQPPAPFDTLFSSPDAARLVENLENSSVTAARAPEVNQAAIDKYDESIAYLDHHLGRLFSELKRQGRWDNTLVVIVSDHGEEFGERGVYFHGNSLYRGSLEVPLLLRFPGAVPAGGSIAVPVSIKDLAATVLDLSGARVTLPGQSLARYWNGRATDNAATADTLLMELNYAPRPPKDAPIAKGPMKSVLRNNLRLIRNGDGREELFDFATDRNERVDLATRPERQGDLQMLREALQALAATRSSPTTLSTR